MTDAEKFVKQKYPNARSSGPWLNGRRVSKNGVWFISGGHLPPHLSAPDVIGRGLTEIAAWADTANKIEFVEKALRTRSDKELLEIRCLMIL